MTKVLGYRVDENLKESYDQFIKDKYGHKQNRCGKSIEILMKLELTVNGNESYKNDPEVKQMLESLGEKLSCTHTHTPQVDVNRVRDSSVDLFAQAFIDEYKDRKEVTKGELSYFASFTQGVVDPRSIQNRINYLVGAGVLDPVAPNIFNIRKECMLGF